MASLPPGLPPRAAAGRTSPDEGPKYCRARDETSRDGGSEKSHDAAMTTSASGLTSAQLDTLRDQLLAAKTELVGRTHGLPPETAQRPEVGDAMDAADRASQTEESGARNERDTVRLADIEHALEKLTRGEYGLSEDSEEPIGFGRLHALPWARLTVAEEEALEKKAD